MPPFETRSSQFGLVSGIRQPASDMVLVAEPAGLFAPEARKGQLYIVAEAEGDVARGRDACQLAIKTIRRLFYEDSSYSVTSSLRKAISATNRVLYEHNFSVAAPKRAVVGMTCAVLKGGDLYIAQILPAQVYILSAGKLRALPPSLSWNSAAATPSPFLKPSALGASLSVEPEFYRAVLHPGDALLICTSNLARMLGQEDMQRRLRSLDPTDISDGLVALCQQNALPEAHGLALVAAPPLSPAAQLAPMSRAGISERGRVAARTAGAWVTRMTGEATLLLRSQARTNKRRTESRIAQGQRDQEQMSKLPEEPPPAPRSIPPTQPLDLGETLEQRMELERQERRGRLGAPPRRAVETGDTPPSAFLGEGAYTSAPAPERRIDLSDTPGMATMGRAYRSSEQPPIEPTLGERIAEPFARLAGAVTSAGHRRRLRRPPPAAMRQGRRGQGLSYRRQGPPFPWHLLLILALVVSAAILYGLNLSREITQRQADDTISRAATAVAAVREAPDEASAQGLLDAASIALANVQATGAITATAENRQRYEELQREYERSLASLQKLTYFDDLTEIARHPTPGGLFGSVVVPPPPQGITATTSFQSIFVLDKIQGVLYRMPRSGGAIQPMLRPEQTIGPFVIGKIKDMDWREDNIIAVAQNGDSGQFVFYYRTGEDWGYNALAGSETWVRAGDHFRAVNYGGNLYVWDGGVAPEQANQIQKYLSGSYGQFPDPWIKNGGGQKIENIVDLAIDGNVYLLRSDGHILVFEAGAFKREIVPQGINPPLSALADFFVTGDPESGSIFLVDLNQRIVEIDKQTGALLQQVRARPDSQLHLDQLRNIYVDTSGVRPVLYLVNGGQVLRGALPDRPRPFRPASATPGPTSAPTRAP
jgi:serine/threonine protein phosphatase PrpC